MLQQFALIDAKPPDLPLPIPAAVALWASVSEEVDQRLSTELDSPMRLRPADWRSGGILWLVDVIGDPSAIPALMQHLQATAFAGRQAKMRLMGPGGQAVVTKLGSGDSAATTAPTGGPRA